MSSSNDISNSSSSSDDTISPQQKPLTASELMRKKFEKKQKSTTKSTNKKTEEVDIDEEIRQLEAELDDGSDSDSDSDSEDDSDSDGDERIQTHQGRQTQIRFGKDTILNPHDVVEKKPNENNSDQGVICISECATETIAPLPQTALPSSKRKKLKIDVESDKRKKESKKRKLTQTDGNQESAVNEGLRDAVKEVLSGYVARSSEKIPFYCRVCSRQSENEEDFQAHKRLDFHKTAVQVEKKATYCKLCRKQLTSPVQMKEHLDSRPHREKMDEVKAQQRGWPMNGFRADRGGRGPGGGRGRGSFQGRGRGPGRGDGRWQNRGPPRSNDKRQWC